MANIGYARVSRRDQDPELQFRDLRAAKCEPIFEEKVSGGKGVEERPALKEALRYCREGDVLVVWKLDRLGRSLRDLIDIPQTLKERGIGFRSLRENLDTTTPGGKLVFHFFGALAEWERDVIRERTFAGLDAARARGRMGGRPKVMNPAKVRNARSLMADPENSVDDVCSILGVSRSTLYKYLREEDDGEERDRPAPEPAPEPASE